MANERKRRYDAAWRAANPERVRANYLADQNRVKADPAKRQARNERQNRRNAELRAAKPPDFRKVLVSILAGWGVKTCLRCETPQVFAEFKNHSLGSSGLSPWCRACDSAYRKTPEARAKSRAAKAARLANMTLVERRKARGYRPRPPKHDAHAVAYHEVGKALAEFVEKMVRRNERRAKKLAAGIPEGVGRNRAKKLRRKHAIERATPAWADRAAIAEIYAEAKRISEERGEVWRPDHLVPLRHPLVCGLHVPANLAVMRHDVNSRKGNAVWPAMP